MTLPERPADRHRQVAGAFAEQVRGVRSGGWDAPAPVPGWTARDVVGHLAWFPAYFTGAHGLPLPTGPGPTDDPVAAWQVQSDAIQVVLDDPATAEREVDDPHMGRLAVATLVDRIYTSDVFLHTWDLARATGQDDRLDPDFCAQLLAGMEPLDELLRSSGQYGPPVPVPAGADAQTRLLGFIGRDPEWRP